MMEARRIDEEKSLTEEKWFGSADEQYRRFKEWLESREARGMEHSELEKEIEREGYELMRLLYQDHLILRAWSEGDAREQGPVVGSDGRERRLQRARVPKPVSARCRVELAERFVFPWGARARGTGSREELVRGNGGHADEDDWSPRGQAASGEAGGGGGA